MRPFPLLAAGLLAAPTVLVAQAPSWTMDGSLSGSRNGFRVVVIGDYNGNGTDDVLIGEPGDLGANFVPAGGSAAIRDGNGSCITIFYGAQSRRMGSGLARLPDINGDGIDEILLGSPGYFASSSSVLNGRVELFFGGRDGGGAPGCAGSGSAFPDLLIDAPNGGSGQLNGDEFGLEIEALGDLDADGRADFVVGAPNGHQTPTYGDLRGYVQVYSSSLAFGGVVAPLYRIDGATINSRFGWSICRIGDATGDGIDDFAVGAPDESFGNMPFPGRVYCFSGATGAQFLRIDGVNNQRLGYAIENLGDLDGDGRDDIALGVPGDRPIGATAKTGSVVVVRGSYLYAAGTGAGPSNVGLAQVAAVHRLYGDDLYRTAGISTLEDAFGSAIANVLDVDFDGVNDILIGAPGASLWDPDSQILGNWPGWVDVIGVGGARLLSGASGNCIKQYYSPQPQASSSFGAGVAGGGDFDNDGVPDFVISAPWEDLNNLVDNGRTRAWSGDTEFGYVFGAGLPNSTGAVGSIAAKGAQSVAENRFRIELGSLPTSASGILLMSQVQALPGSALGNGLLYIGDPIVRFGVVTTTDAGTATYPIDLSLPPAAGNLMSLTRWNFQFWHRDVGGTVNLTSALTVGFY